MKMNEVILQPVVTEKATELVQSNVYTFIVHEDANKNQIREVLEKLYKVKVGTVKVTLRKGKVKKVGKKMILKKQPNKKIAYVKLIEGKIDLFPQA